MKYKLSQNKKFSIIMIDLNDFKVVNDTLGHLEGDRILIKVTDILKKNLEVEDTVYRYGGDEFILLLEDEKDKCEKTISDIDKDILKINQKSKKYKVSLSYGCEYVTSPSAYSVEKLLYLVDEKMYEDKLRKKQISDNNISK